MTWKFRFRKSFTKGPFRWTLTKKGIGTSWGFPGFRFSISADGKPRMTIGIPGTGLYWTNDLKPSKQKPPGQQSPRQTATPQSTSQPQPTSQPPPTTQNPQQSQSQQGSTPWWKQKGLKP